MKADEVKDYLQNIGEWVLDEDKILTYKWLSKTLSIHVNTSKQLLYTYLSGEKNKSSCNVSATYLLAGKLKDGSLCVTVVNEDDLKTAYENFEEITAEHVYSVQKAKSIKDLQILYAANKSVSDTESFGSPIKCSDSVLRLREPSTNHRRENEVKQVHESLGKVKAAAEGGKAKESKKETENVKNSKSASETSKEKKAVGNKKGDIANFFGNAAASKKSKPKEESESKAKVSEKSETEGRKEKSNPPNAVPEKHAGSDSVPERRSNKKKKVDNEGKKRKRIKVFSDSESSGNESSRERSPSPMNTDEVKVEPDSEVVVQEIETENVQETTAQNKRKKRKIIDKTVMSEDGFIETKKEVVYETDSENEEKPAEKRQADPVQDPPKRISPRKKGKQATDNSNTKPTANSKKQSSLYSFFKKN